MTIRKAKARNIDNRRLLSLLTGAVFMPRLGIKVPWEGYGERAALLLADRRPGLRFIASQPERMTVEVDGRRVRYTPDYEAHIFGAPSEIWEIKGHRQLQEETVQAKLAAVELAVARSGRVFRLFDSYVISTSQELRNVQILRRYARYDVPPEQVDFIRRLFDEHGELSLGQLVSRAQDESISRAQIYALLYRDELTFDWSQFINEMSAIRRGGARADT